VLKSRKNEVRHESAAALSILISAMLLAVVVIAEAQQAKKIPRIGYLAADPQGPTRDSFRHALRELGYVEGQSILIEWRYAEDKIDPCDDVELFIERKALV
jgi:hypothetical protein